MHTHHDMLACKYVAVHAQVYHYAHHHMYMGVAAYVPLANTLLLT